MRPRISHIFRTTVNEGMHSSQVAGDYRHGNHSSQYIRRQKSPRVLLSVSWRNNWTQSGQRYKITGALIVLRIIELIFEKLHVLLSLQFRVTLCSLGAG